MKEIVTKLLVVLGTAFVAVPLAAQSPHEFEVSDRVSSCLVLRAEPRPQASRLSCMPPGTRVSVVGTTAYWRQVRLEDGLTGWAAKKFLVAVEVADSSEAAATEALREDAWLEVHFVDVGQGDGIWIQTFDDAIPGNGRYEGRSIIIDGGPDASDARNEMLRYVRERAHEGAPIDALIVSHPHDDHYPGAHGILRHFEVREYYDPGFPKEGQKYAQFLDAVRAETFEGAPIRLRIGRDEFGTPDWGDELEARFLYSYPGSNEGLGSGSTRENNASIVLRLAYGNVSFLFMGDAEGKDRNSSPMTPKYVERILLEQVGDRGLKSTVLKIGHHGSETSSTLPFIEAVDPEIVVVQSGRRSYGGRFLPDRTTLQRYCAHNPAIRIYRTDQDDEAEGHTTTTDADGDHVIIRTNGRTVTVEAYSAGTRVTPSACTP